MSRNIFDVFSEPASCSGRGETSQNKDTIDLWRKHGKNNNLLLLLKPQLQAKHVENVNAKLTSRVSDTCSIVTEDNCGCSQQDYEIDCICLEKLNFEIDEEQVLINEDELTVYTDDIEGVLADKNVYFTKSISSYIADCYSDSDIEEFMKNMTLASIDLFQNLVYDTSVLTESELLSTKDEDDKQSANCEMDTQFTDTTQTNNDDAQMNEQHTLSEVASLLLQELNNQIVFDAHSYVKPKPISNPTASKIVLETNAISKHTSNKYLSAIHLPNAILKKLVKPVFIPRLPDELVHTSSHTAPGHVIQSSLNLKLSRRARTKGEIRLSIVDQCKAGKRKLQDKSDDKPPPLKCVIRQISDKESAETRYTIISCSDENPVLFRNFRRRPPSDDEGDSYGNGTTRNSSNTGVRRFLTTSHTKSSANGKSIDNARKATLPDGSIPFYFHKCCPIVLIENLCVNRPNEHCNNISLQIEEPVDLEKENFNKNVSVSTIDEMEPPILTPTFKTIDSCDHVPKVDSSKSVYDKSKNPNALSNRLSRQLKCLESSSGYCAFQNITENREQRKIAQLGVILDRQLHTKKYSFLKHSELKESERQKQFRRNGPKVDKSKKKPKKISFSAWCGQKKKKFAPPKLIVRKTKQGFTCTPKKTHIYAPFAKAVPLSETSNGCENNVSQTARKRSKKLASRVQTARKHCRNRLKKEEDSVESSPLPPGLDPKILACFSNGQPQLDHFGRSALHASMLCFTEFNINFAIAIYKDNLNHSDNEGLSALHLGVIHGNKRGVELLLAAAADVNIQGGDLKNTPLHEAILSGNFDISKLLIECGANTNLRNKNNQTPADLMSVNENHDFQTLIVHQDQLASTFSDSVDTMAPIYSSFSHLPAIYHLRSPKAPGVIKKYMLANEVSLALRMSLKEIKANFNGDVKMRIMPHSIMSARLVNWNLKVAFDKLPQNRDNGIMNLFQVTPTLLQALHISETLVDIDYCFNIRSPDLPIESDDDCSIMTECMTDSSELSDEEINKIKLSDHKQISKAMRVYNKSIKKSKKTRNHRRAKNVTEVEYIHTNAVAYSKYRGSTDTVDIDGLLRSALSRPSTTSEVSSTSGFCPTSKTSVSTTSEVNSFSSTSTTDTVKLPTSNTLSNSILQIATSVPKMSFFGSRCLSSNVQERPKSHVTSKCFLDGNMSRRYLAFKKPKKAPFYLPDCVDQSSCQILNAVVPCDNGSLSDIPRFNHATSGTTVGQATTSVNTSVSCATTASHIRSNCIMGSSTSLSSSVPSSNQTSIQTNNCIIRSRSAQETVTRIPTSLSSSVPSNCASIKSPFTTGTTSSFLLKCRNNLVQMSPSSFKRYQIPETRGTMIPVDSTRYHSPIPTDQLPANSDIPNPPSNNTQGCTNEVRLGHGSTGSLSGLVNDTTLNRGCTPFVTVSKDRLSVPIIPGNAAASIRLIKCGENCTHLKMVRPTSDATKSTNISSDTCS